jgi:hypothetical protein
MTFVAGALVLVAFATPAMAANTLTVTGAAALEGSFGLSINLDGTAGPPANLNDTYVVTSEPIGETTYNFSFRIYPGTLNMDASTALKFFLVGNVRKATPDRNFLFVYFMKQADGWWSMQANTRQDNGSFPAWQVPVKVCHPTNPAILCSSIDFVEIRYEWVASSGPGMNNGSLEVYRDGLLARTFSGLDNDTQTVEEAWFGAIFMANGTHNSASVNAGGSLYFDSFVSTR